MGKFLAILLAIAGGVFASQGPGFTLQYMQNLNGRIAELKPLVEKFDADVAVYGYTRETAIKECATATGLLDALCNGYESAVLRYEELTAHYAELSSANEYMKPILLAQTYMEDIATSVMEEFKPAVPTTTDGAAYAAGGFFGIWVLASILFGILGLPFRRRDPEGRWA